MSRFLLFFILLCTKIAFTQSSTLSIYFDSDQSTISSIDINNLENLKRGIEKDSIKIISFNAYCDTSGSVRYNEILAKKRLNSVLGRINLTAKEIKCSIYGENYPITQPEFYNKRDWRRVDIEFEKRNNINAITIPEPTNPTEFHSIFEELVLDSLLKNDDPTIVLNIQFVPGTDQLYNDSSYYELEKLFQFMKNNPKAHAFIRGHVCCGSDAYLAHSRAYVVYTFLVRRAISQKRIEFKGFDNTMPLVWPELTDADRQKNRRVDVVFSRID